MNNTMKIRIISAILLSATLAISAALHAGHVTVVNWSTKTIFSILQSEECNNKVCTWGKLLPLDPDNGTHYSWGAYYSRDDGDHFWMTISTLEHPKHGQVFSLDLPATGMTRCHFNIDKQDKKSLKCVPGGS
ncbi:MAG: hypothetical protein KZQ60_09025 [Candidatus Thiodiazotropha sp. (ex Lucinoma aequizonata)]|nr:hypothetical protein [Candidatus Thiodiazotropha sp. (ex Lucinoma aequizonata)]MCU7887487.1 hypothetical protein [Candidatus Thiodiazotropha sp. (ex Lucinoma aequizonata)]MCU7894076.1 hypothetical protein [Candidatus Thiodiazotropha sp. (ex Lucinoma aequizonata)]MCU7899692.1 hypothetical protein [Candidatus Thiodiazotropha sp. (ex Lucinoma aequizonata)]MCU7899753.1 hypothetical protein [Candidatus Thiodiazotropha sp. (ex Lucinoma aequizonata)]